MKDLNKKTVTYILNIIFIAFAGIMVYRIFFGSSEIGDIIEDVRKADTFWTVTGLIVLVAFVCCESWIIHYMLRIYKIKISFLRCIRYSFVGFFYSCITPSSSGGQPMQIVYMKRDGIKIGYSTLILWIITIAYKSALVILGTVFLVFKRSFLEAALGEWLWLLILGYCLNVGLLSIMILVLIKPALVQRVGIKLIKVLSALHIIKNVEKYVLKVARISRNYSVGAQYVRTHLRVCVRVMLISLLQRLLLSSITFIVYKAYGLTGDSFLTIVAIQTVIGIMVEMMPLPGAAGISEACFMVLFECVFGALVKPAMLLSRGISFYALLLLGGIVTLGSAFFARKHPIEEQDFDVK